MARLDVRFAGRATHEACMPRNSTRPRPWRARLYLGLLSLSVALLLADQVARVIGDDVLYRSLGEATYNRVRPMLIMYAAAVLPIGVAIDVLVRVMRAAVDLVRRRRASGRSLAGPATVVLALSAGVLLVVHAWHARHPDPLLDEPLAWIFDEHTQFAPGCNDGAFAGITPGMTRADVEARLGEPLGVMTTNSGDMAYYARDADGGSYRRRVVVYDHRAGRVREVVAGLSID